MFPLSGVEDGSSFYRDHLSGQRGSGSIYSVDRHGKAEKGNCPFFGSS